MGERLQPILALLDEGIALYRRNFGGFALITATWLVPVAIAAGLLIVAASWLDEGLGILLSLAGIVLLFPLTIYLIGGLSRGAAAAIEGRPLRFREAMAIPPLRAAGMGCFTLIYLFVAQIASNLLSLICICPLFFGGAAIAGAVGPLLSDTEALGVVAGVFIILAVFGVYALLLVASGAVYSSLIYGLQPWVQEPRPFGEALQQSLNMLGYRFWRNLLVWGLTALLVAAVGVTVTATIGVILPLPLTYALGSDSTAAQAVSVGAWMLGFVVVLPPLPIWMVLLYRRNRAAREGSELDTAVQGWWRERFGEPTTEDREPRTENHDAA
jgi:hypothetical protein